MLKKQIKQGGIYLAKVNGKLVPCRVDQIRTSTHYSGGKPTDVTVYDVTNLKTKRTTLFRSASKFREECDKDGKPLASSKAKGKSTETLKQLKGSPVHGLPSNPLADAVKETVNDKINELEEQESCPFVDSAGTVDSSAGSADTPAPSLGGEQHADPIAVPAAASTSCPTGTTTMSAATGEARTCERCDGAGEVIDGYDEDGEPYADQCGNCWGTGKVHATEEDELEDEEIGNPTGLDDATEETMAAAELERDFVEGGEVYLNLKAPEALSLAGDQPQAFQTITRMLANGARVIKLAGAAGTGKTFLTAQLVKWAKRQGYDVKVSAPTHKACGVLGEKLKDIADLELRTIHSLLGLRLEPDMENDTGGRILIATESTTKVNRGLVFVDEGSMVGVVLLDHIEQTPNVSWVFIGDLAQLPPVGEGVSELLVNPDAELNTVLRQAKESEILNLATAVRHGDLSLSFTRGKDVTKVKDAESLFQAAYKRFATEEYKKNASHCRMLVFKNARRRAINSRMRDLLVGLPEPYTPGEWLVMYSQFSPDKSRLNSLAERARQYRKGDPGYGAAWKQFFNYKEKMERAGQAIAALHVSEEVRILSVSEGNLTIDGNDFACWRLTVLSSDEREIEMPVIKGEELDRYEDCKTQAASRAHEYRKLRDTYPKGSDRWQAQEKLRKAAWGTFFAYEDSPAWVDYAYSCTVHKAQGSTFEHVYIDMPDLLTAGGMKQRIVYTAITRASKSVTFYA